MIWFFFEKTSPLVHAVLHVLVRRKGLGEGAPTAPYTGSLSSLLMAPKIDKKVQQAAAKKIEDSTFGMKNKNKCVAQPRKSSALDLRAGPDRSSAALMACAAPPAGQNRCRSRSSR